jgi:hypothetical protein
MSIIRLIHVKHVGWVERSEIHPGSPKPVLCCLLDRRSHRRHKRETGADVRWYCSPHTNCRVQP